MRRLSPLRRGLALFLTRLVLATTPMIGFGQFSSAALANGSDAAVKAAIVFNFTQFISRAETEADAAVSLCVTSDADIHDDLVAIGRKAAGPRITVVTLVDVQDYKDCDFIYLSDAAAHGELPLAMIRDGRVTISSSKEFAKIGVVEIGRQYRFEINNTLAQENGVSISSRLLRIATRVH